MDRTHVQYFHYLKTEVPKRYLKCDAVGWLQGLKIYNGLLPLLK